MFSFSHPTGCNLHLPSTPIRLPPSSIRKGACESRRRPQGAIGHINIASPASPHQHHLTNIASPASPHSLGSPAAAAPISAMPPSLRLNVGCESGGRPTHRCRHTHCLRSESAGMPHRHRPSREVVVVWRGLVDLRQRGKHSAFNYKMLSGSLEAYPCCTPAVPLLRNGGNLGGGMEAAHS